jgi:hypothetical protein
MLAKLVVARCINSALLIYLATNFDDTFGLDSLYQMQNILIADAITTPLIRLLNPYDFFMRYVYGPKTARTQEEYVQLSPLLSLDLSRPLYLSLDFCLSLSAISD